MVYVVRAAGSAHECRYVFASGVFYKTRLLNIRVTQRTHVDAQQNALNTHRHYKTHLSNCSVLYEFYRLRIL